MKIKVERTLVELTPESDEEARSLEDLWKLMVDCAKFNKKLVPVGEYYAQINKVARFNIEE